MKIIAPLANVTTTIYDPASGSGSLLLKVADKNCTPNGPSLEI